MMQFISFALVVVADSYLPPLEYANALPPLAVTRHALYGLKTYQSELEVYQRLHQWSDDLQRLKCEARILHRLWNAADDVQIPTFTQWRRRVALLKLMQWMGWETIEDMCTRPLPVPYPGMNR